MSRSAMTVLYWARLRERRDGSIYSERTRQHVSIDGAATVCGYDVPPGAAVVATTAGGQPPAGGTVSTG